MVGSQIRETRYCGVSVHLHGGESDKRDTVLWVVVSQPAWCAEGSDKRDTVEVSSACLCARHSYVYVIVPFRDFFLFFPFMNLKLGHLP